ncbi:hypothetical protein [Lacrimispora sp.]|uniref:hypothetical protein n=1 Tax=Lacrimispora sp. TaxID=2719234 RepID=UPI0039943B34
MEFHTKMKAVWHPWHMPCYLLIATTIERAEWTDSRYLIKGIDISLSDYEGLGYSTEEHAEKRNP